MEITPEYDPFFPKKGSYVQIRVAQQVCLNCPVRTDCKDYKDRTQPTAGVWAGDVIRRGD